MQLVWFACNWFPSPAVNPHQSLSAPSHHPSTMPIRIGHVRVDVEVSVWHGTNGKEADAADGRKGQSQAQGLVLCL